VDGLASVPAAERRVGPCHAAVLQAGGQAGTGSHRWQRAGL